MLSSFNPDNFCQKMDELNYSVECGITGGDFMDFVSDIETLLTFDLVLTQAGFENIDLIL
jgi:hypothetical protein